MGAAKKAVAAAVKWFTSWSFSRFKDWRECPARAKYQHLDKLPQGPKGPALIRGQEIHLEAEHYVGGCSHVTFNALPKERRRMYKRQGDRYFLKDLPASFALFRKELKELRDRQAIAEGKWAVTVKWAVIDFFDWKNAWLRVVLDSHFCPTPKLARVIDYKTGRMYGDNEEQMDLYALTGFEHYPSVNELSTELWYVDQPREADQGKPTANPKIKVYKRTQVPALRKRWETKVQPMLADRRFPPKPGDYCRYCPYSKRKAGPCKF